MNKYAKLNAALIAAALASPALADDMAVDVEQMVEEAASNSYNPITPKLGGFDIASLTNGQRPEFMATMPSGYTPGYRLSTLKADFEQESSSAGPAALFVPEEFAFRSSKQDSGVDAVVPGEFLSTSVRSDFLSEIGPAAQDKSSVGFKFDF